MGCWIKYTQSTSVIRRRGESIMHAVEGTKKHGGSCRSPCFALLIVVMSM